MINQRGVSYEHYTAKEYLEAVLPALKPEELTNLKYIGVGEVARAKGHDYMTVVYNMDADLELQYIIG